MRRSFASIMCVNLFSPRIYCWEKTHLRNVLSRPIAPDKKLRFRRRTGWMDAVGRGMSLSQVAHT